MDDFDGLSTRVSLVLRIKAGDGRAWAEFVELYGRPLLRRLKKHHLQEADAQDVVQDVLLKVWKAIEEFDYDPTRSFRGWLITVAKRALIDWWHKTNRPGQRGIGGEAVLPEPTDPQGFGELLADIADIEIFYRALAAVRSRVASSTWRVFEMRSGYTLGGKPLEIVCSAPRSPTEVASELAMELGAVNAAYCRTKQFLMEEVSKLNTNRFE